MSGWMKLAPRASLPKLRGRSVYRKLDLGPDDGVLSIGCMLVRPDARGQGVARALVTAATRLARDRGASAIEAYPHAATTLGAHEVWMGPHALFASLGFQRVAGEDAYPVLRFTL
jgi:GNAT superfamily N-acetyltransferase